MQEDINLTFLGSRRIVRIDTGGTIHVVTLYRRIREWEASAEGIAYPEILEGSGNIELPDRSRTPLVIVFVNGWRLDSSESVQLVGGALSARDSDRKTDHPVVASARDRIRFPNDTTADFVPSEAQIRYASFEAAKFREDWSIDPERKVVYRRAEASERIHAVFGLYWYLKEEWLRSADLAKFSFPIEGDNHPPIPGVDRRWTLLHGWSIPESDLNYLAGGPLIVGQEVVVPAYSRDERPGSQEAVRNASKRNAIKIGVLTALPKEFAAVCAQLDELEDYGGAVRGLRCRIGSVPACGAGTHHVAVAMSLMGNTSAASKASALLHEFPELKEVIMVGIAGAVPNPEKPSEHVRLGDIVVSGPYGVVQYDFVKETETWKEARHPPRVPSSRFLEVARLLEADLLIGKAPWIQYLDRCASIRNSSRPSPSLDLLARTDDPSTYHPHPQDPDRPKEDEPRLFVGTIGAASVLLKNPVRRDQLRDVYGIRAIEMESSGIANSSWDFQVGFFVIRGTCDYCDGNKNDDWQGYAAAIASAFLIALLRATYEIR